MKHLSVTVSSGDIGPPLQQVFRAFSSLEHISKAGQFRSRLKSDNGTSYF